MSFTIGDVACLLDNTIFYYEIITDKTVLDDITIDQLHRHYIEKFAEYKTNGYSVDIFDGKQYLGMTLELTEDWDGDYEESLATQENMHDAFCDYNIRDNKLIIPSSFVDCIYVEADNANYKEIDDIVFKFSYITPEKEKLWEYFTIE